MKRIVAALLLASSGVVGASAFPAPMASAADAPVLPGLHHEGAKALHGGDNRRAEQLLSSAVEAGSKDPRCYYFLGLSEWRLGRAADADRNFKKGAEIEGRDFDVFFNVSRALERIQGSERL